MPNITMKINKKTGEARIEANGYTGQTCKAATQFLADTLGTCKDWEAKAEWYTENIETSGTVDSNLCG